MAPRQRAALKAHWLELAIVIATPPFLPSVLGFARLARRLRLARLALVAGRAIAAARVFTSRQGFRSVALTTSLLVIVAGAAISLVDTRDFPNVWVGIWWAIVTVTTVGYGDIVPHSVAGRLVASLLMLVGIGFISLLTATVASTFIRHDEDESRTSLADLLATLRRIEEPLDRLERQNR